jgi:hypothetical protein
VYLRILEWVDEDRQRSLDRCCRGRATSGTYSQCVRSLCNAACIAHAPYGTVICGLSGCNIFFHIIRIPLDFLKTFS